MDLHQAGTDLEGTTAPPDLSPEGPLDFQRTDGRMLAFRRELVATPHWARAIGAGDFDGDGQIDVVLGGGDSGAIVTLRNRGASMPAFEVAASVPATGTVLNDIAVGDVNRDGKLDVVAVGEREPNLFVLLGDGDGNFQAVRTPLPSDALAVRLADFDRDGLSDLAIAGVRGGEGTLLLLRNGGAGRFIEAASHSTGLGAGRIAVGDLDGDGRTDVVTVDPIGNSVSVLPGTGGFLLGARRPVGVDGRPTAVQLGRLDEDGMIDAVVALEKPGAVGFLRGDGAGALMPTFTFAAGMGPQALEVADFNGDARPDVAELGDSDQLSLLLGAGGGLWSPPNQFVLAAGPRAIAVADFNGDARPDIAAACGVDSLAILWNTSQ